MRTADGHGWHNLRDMSPKNWTYVWEFDVYLVFSRFVQDHSPTEGGYWLLDVLN